MLKQFYEKALPSQGVYCVCGIGKDGDALNHFAETLDDAIALVDTLNSRNINVFVAPNSFKSHSRRGENALFSRSFFIDLDVGKGYETKADAVNALNTFIEEHELPPPAVIDSGNGVHAYWMFDEDIPVAIWKVYAEKFKKYCLDNNLQIDRVVTADVARIMRAPDTFNHKSSPPKPTGFLNDHFHQYSFDAFKEFLGVVDPTTEMLVLAAKRGLDEDTRMIMKSDNIESVFDIIATKSMNGEGCNQIRYVIENAETLSEPMWHSGLSIARQCADWEEAIHELSKWYPQYSPEQTIRKANETFDKPHSCSVFEQRNPGGCEGCPFRGKITNPLALGRHLREAPPIAEEDPVWENPNPQEVPEPDYNLPDALRPYVRGATGGIYFIPSSEEDEPVLILPQYLIPVKRMYSPMDGECLTMMLYLPHDPSREFLLPMKHVYATDKLREILTSNGVFFNPAHDKHIVSYLIKWGQYLLNKHAAEQMRMQMGWTENRESFVIGNREIMSDGSIRMAPASPFVRNIAKLLKPEGSYQVWQEAATKLNMPGFEIHAFTLLCGFGSTLMSFTSTAGMTLCLTGKSGNAKTGALYGCLSTFGNPKELSVFDATENGMVGRYLGLKNLVLGLDEVSNKPALALSQTIHRVSHGKTKIRMQASVNAERDLEMSASLLSVWTSNQSGIDKMTDLKASPDGELARFIELMVPRPQPMADNPQLGREIFNVFPHNYGHAGPEFIAHCYKLGLDTVANIIEKWTKRFNKDFGSDTAYRFYENMVGAVMGSGEIAADGNIVVYDLERLYKEVVMLLIKLRSGTVKLNEMDYNTLIGDFMNRNVGGMLVVSENGVVTEPRTALVARGEVHNHMLYISKSAFKAFLSERQVSSREFEFAMREGGTLVFDDKQRLSKGWRGVNTPPVFVYGFKTEIPEDILSGD